MISIYLIDRIASIYLFLVAACVFMIRPRYMYAAILRLILKYLSYEWYSIWFISLSICICSLFHYSLNHEFRIFIGNEKQNHKNIYHFFPKENHKTQNKNKKIWFKTHKHTRQYKRKRNRSFNSKAHTCTQRVKKMFVTFFLNLPFWNFGIGKKSTDGANFKNFQKQQRFVFAKNYSNFPA